MIFILHNAVFTNKRSQGKVSTVYSISSIGSGSQVSAIYSTVYCIMFKYAAVHRAPNRELTLHCSVLIHLEDR